MQGINYAVNNELIIRLPNRYAVLTKETWPMNKWTGSERAAVEHILAYGKVKPDEYQLGNTKVFIKEPASVSH